MARSRYCNRKKCDKECKFLSLEWKENSILKDILVCKIDPNVPEVLIFENTISQMVNIYKNCLTRLQDKSKVQFIHNLEQKCIDKEPLTTNENALLTLWENNSDARSNIPPLEYAVNDSQVSHDIQAKLYTFFDTAVKILQT